MRTIGISLALPLFVGGVLLAAIFGLSKSAGATEEEGDTAIEIDERAARPAADDDEPGYGYVFAHPDEDEPVDAAEKAAEMERAAVLARLGTGWERGELLADDLRILVASARSQLAVYEEELARLERDPNADLEALRTRHREAQTNLQVFEEAGERLRQAMVGLQGDFEEVETERRAARPAD